MKTYKGNFEPEYVLEMVVQNSFFPHSLMYSLYQVYKYFQRLKPESLPESYEELDYQIGKTMNMVKYSNIDMNDGKKINDFLLETRQQINNIATCFGKYYFGNS